MSFDIRPLTSHEHASIPDLRAVASTAADVDGVAPLNEASLLALETLEQHSPGSGAHRGYLAFDGARLVGAAVDAEGDGSAVDLVVAPDARRRGAGTALLQAVLHDAPQAAVWAHGSLDVAAAFAARSGMEPVRELWVMSRDVAPGETFDTTLAEGFVARRYDGSDEQAEAWLTVNAAAFATHPEQGRMTMDDFRRRREEPWFDPDGLVLVWDESTQPARLAASHWTKREPGEDVGEVYVVAVAPEYQGRGLSRPLTALGLEHLARSGVSRVELYVEGDNEPAKAAYVRAGFSRSTGDTMYMHASARSEGSTTE